VNSSIDIGTSKRVLASGGVHGLSIQLDTCLESWDREPSPMLLDFVLGPLQEEYLRRAMILADGDATVLVQRPLSAALLASAAALLGMVLLPSVRKRREEVFAEEEEGTKRRSIDFASHTPRAGAPGGTSANRGRLDAWLYQTGRPVAL
jgi:hypothetical protein